MSRRGGGRGHGAVVGSSGPVRRWLVVVVVGLLIALSGCRAGPDDAASIDHDPEAPDAPTAEPATSETSSADVTEVQEPLVLVVDLFSGRPNPRAELVASELAKVQAAVASRPFDSDRREALGEGLGFRGFRLTPYVFEGVAYAMIVNQTDVVLSPLTDGSLSADEQEVIVLGDDDQILYRLCYEIAEAAFPEVVKLVPPPDEVSPESGTG